MSEADFNRLVPHLRCWDAVVFLCTLLDESVNLIVVDPAYESLEKHRAKGTTTRLKHSKSSSNDWFPIFPNQRFEDFFRAAYRALAKNSHLYMLCDQETMFHVVPIAKEAGFTFWKPLIWDKVNMGMGYHYRASYEVILFFEKGKRKLNDLGIRDVLRVKKIRTDFATEKPVELLTTLIEQSSSKGEIVCDPFMGSGSTGEAALRCGRRFVGSDIWDHAYRKTEDRLIKVVEEMCP